MVVRASLFLLPLHLLAAGFAQGLLPTKSFFQRLPVTVMSFSNNNPMAGDPFHLPTPLILGSASFTRKLILEEMGVEYQIVVRAINEQELGDRQREEPADLVLRLGEAKMDHLVQEIRAGRCQDDLPASFAASSSNLDFVVLTGDQVVSCNGKILEKPESVEEARQMVSEFGRHPPSTVGSCVLCHVATGIQVSGVDTATVYFQKDTPVSLVDQLIADNAPVMSCAGALMSEHPLVKKYITRIDGTEDSVMGLSKELVLRLFGELSQKVQAATQN